jgi:hypothetical protein
MRHHCKKIACTQHMLNIATMVRSQAVAAVKTTVGWDFIKTHVPSSLVCTVSVIPYACLLYV